MQTCLVLLASYNGEEYIQEQINSIIDSRNNNLHILIRDDGSYDRTLDIITSIQAPNITLIQANPKDPHGHLANFITLSNEATKTDYKYYAFSDQDDVWHENKLIHLIEKIEKIEKKSPPNTPILVHCDLRVVDNKLVEISPSFHKYQGLTSQQTLPLLLHRNNVTGCATLFNKSLLSISVPIPLTATVHDHWFALCAEYFGIKEFVNMSLVDYRQHETNAIGAKSIKNNFLDIFNPEFYRLIKRFPGYLSQAVEQAKSLEIRRMKCDIIVSKEKQDYIKGFASLKNLTMYSRIRKGLAYFPNEGILRKIFVIFVLIILPKITCRKEKYK